MKKQNGFSLIEILITLIIMSYGLLGVAGIIVNSLKVSQSSYSRSQASLLANDIIDRMRANRVTAEKTPCPCPYDLALNGTPGGTGVSLSDLTEWQESLTSTLPSGTGSVALNETTKKRTVTIQWDDSRAIRGSNSQNITIETRL